jgi:hypothetical protein
MGIDYSIAGLLGGLGGAMGNAQQQINPQWQLLQGTGTDTFSGSAWNTAQTSTYVVSTCPVEATPIKAKGPETALEWLDRRVAEVRLPLAA